MKSVQNGSYLLQVFKLFSLTSITILLAFFPTASLGQRDGAEAVAGGNLMGLISPRDIADLTQMATQLAAQTMQTNSELLNKPGGDDVRPLSLNARPSEIFSQGLTNIMQPAKQHLSKALQQPATSFFTSSSNGLAPGTGSSSNSAMNIDSNTIEHLQPLKEPVGSAQGEPLSLFSAPTKIPKTVGSTVTGNGNDHHVLAAGDTLLKIANSFLGTGTSTNNGYYSYGNEYDVDGLRRNDVGPSQGSDGLSKGITNVNAAVEFLE